MNWKRAARWVATIIAGLVLVAFAAIAILLRSPRFHLYVLNTAERIATEKIGAPVNAQDYALHWETLGLDLYGVRVLGADGPAYPPLLQVDHIGAGFKIVSVLRRDLRLDHLVLDHPVVYLTFDAQGRSNIPTPRSSGGNQTDVFEMAVQDARLERGEIYYNNRKSGLDADLHELEIHSRFDNVNSRYFGALSYHDGHLQYDGYSPIPHDLAFQFVATRQKFTVEKMDLASGSSHLSLTATLENYAQPHVQGSYVALIDTEEFRRAMKMALLPSGTVQVNGTVDNQTDPTRALLETVSASGDVTSKQLNVRTPSLSTSIRNLSAHYQLAKGNAELRDISALLLGGALKADLTMRDLTGNTTSRLTATLRDISVAEVERTLAEPMKQVIVTGRSTADVEATWGKSIQDLQARVDATMHGALSGTKSAPGSQPIPLDVALHARYAAARKELTLAQSSVHTPQTQVMLDGTISNAPGRGTNFKTHSNLQVRVQANDLSELEAAADSFQESPQPLGLAGRATFNGVVRGSTASPQFTGQLTATDLKARGTSWKRLRTDVSLSPSEAGLRNGELDPAQQGHVAFDVRVGLHNWSFLPESPITITASAAQLQVEPFLKAANISYPVEGLLSANLSLHGSELNPVGEGAIKLAKAKVQAETIQSLNVNFKGTGDSVKATLNLRLPAGTAQGELTYFPKQRGYEVSLQADDLKLEQLGTLKQRNLPVSGLLWLSATGRGTLDDPGAVISVEVTKLKVQDRSIDTLKLSGNVQHHVATVALDSQIASASLHGRGRIELEGDYQANVTLDTDDIPLQTLLVAYMPAQAADLGGNTVIHASLKGPLKKPDALNVHLELPVLALTYKDLEFSAVTPIHADYADGVVKLERAEIHGTGTDLQVQGVYPLRSTAAATLNAKGTLDLQVLKIFQPDLQSSGQVKFDVHTEGSFTNPNLQGQAEIVNANLRSEGLITSLQNANGILRFNNDRVQVTKFEGTVGGGTVQASGAVVFRPSLRFDLAMAANGVRVSALPGVRSQLSGNIGLTGNMDAALLRGAISIDSLSFTPDFDLSTFMSQFNANVTPPAAEGFTNNVRLSLSIQTTSALNLVSRTLSVQGSADLRVAGTAADPVILGRANLTGGDVIFLGNRYVVEGGTVEFVNPVRTEPLISLQATTSIQQYDINLSLHGPADRLQATYTSNPALPPVDIIHLIAFGSTSTSAAASGQSTMSPESVVASQVSSELTSRVAKLAGISQLSVNPNVGGSTGGKNAGPTISVQQRITSKLYVTFTADLTSTQNQTVQVQYDISKRWSLSTTRDQNGGFGFDGRFRKSW